jgi:hypothetical protein
MSDTHSTANYALDFAFHDCVRPAYRNAAAAPSMAFTEFPRQICRRCHFFGQAELSPPLQLRDPSKPRIGDPVLGFRVPSGEMRLKRVAVTSKKLQGASFSIAIR